MQRCSDKHTSSWLYRIQLMTHITTYNRLLFCDFPATRFGLYMPSSGWSFSKGYSYKKDNIFEPSKCVFWGPCTVCCSRPWKWCCLATHIIEAHSHKWGPKVVQRRGRSMLPLSNAMPRRLTNSQNWHLLATSPAPMVFLSFVYVCYKHCIVGWPLPAVKS